MIIFKQWIYRANKSNYKNVNKNMMGYISTRDGVELNDYNVKISEKYLEYISKRDGVAKEDMEHGLFGKLNDMKYTGDVRNLSSAKEYIGKLCENKTTIYNGIISLSEEEAFRLDITTKKDFTNMLKQNIYKIASKMGIAPSNLEWCGAVHLKEGHPHVHLMYWDKNQKIGVNYVNPKVSDNIRKELNNNIIGEDLHTLTNEKYDDRTFLKGEYANKIRYNLTNNIYKKELEAIRYEKDTANKEFKTAVSNIFFESKNVLGNMKNSDIYSFLYTNPARILDPTTVSSKSLDLMEDIMSVERLIKTDYKKGGIKYQYLPIHIKEAVDDVVEKILNGSNSIVTEEYIKFLNATKKQAEIYGGDDNIKGYILKADENLRKNVANSLLSVVKDINKNTKEFEQFIKDTNNKKTIIYNFMQNILTDIFTHRNDINLTILSHNNNYKNLSRIDKDKIKHDNELSR